MGKGKSKRYAQQLACFDRAQQYSVDEAIAKLKEMPHVKFDETVEVAFRLGIDPRQSDQALRGALPLPHGTGRNVRVVVIATGEEANAAREAGADEVGFEELLDRIKDGWLDFDMMIATQATMPKVRTLGRVLGPRGLMPNPKTGTLTADPAAAVAEAKRGRAEYRADKGGCVHVRVGKVSFSETALAENFEAVLQAILRARPASAKGSYVMSCTLSSTMSPGVRIDPHGLERS